MSGWESSENILEKQYGAIERKIVPISEIVLPADAVRQHYDDRKLDELAAAIARQGILSPPVVRPLPSGRYELVAGGRRLRAARKLDLQHLPVLVIALSDERAREISLAENLQREDLNVLEATEGVLKLLSLKLEKPPCEVARLLQRLARRKSRGTLSDNVTGRETLATIEEVFAFVGAGTWQSFARNRLPLLALPPLLQSALRQNRIAYTKALEIAKVRDPQRQAALLEAAIAQKLSLSQIRARAREPEARTISDASTAKSRLAKIQTQLERSRVWDSDRKRRELEGLLSQLEALLGT